MKLLLDENLPVKIKTYFSDIYVVATFDELEHQTQHVALWTVGYFEKSS